ncbi:peroxin [Tulasnella sp. 403]|nr:peroxin [Tulasnella sp. 403]
MGKLEEMPPGILDKIIHEDISQSPESVSKLVTSLSVPIHQSACRLVFRTLSLPDDARLFATATASQILPLPNNPVSAFIANPQRYGPYVRLLCITDPVFYGPVGTSSASLGLFGEFDVIHEEEADIPGSAKWNVTKADGDLSPIPAETLVAVLGMCPNLEELIWAGLCPPPDGLCEASQNPFNLWSKLDTELMPKSLKHLKIGIPESGPSHSWALDHLQSFHSFPLHRISHLSIVRSTPPGYDVAENVVLRPVPRDILRFLYESGGELKSLECDWWGWGPEDLRVVLEHCPSLEVIRVMFDAPFNKLIGLAGSIAMATNLRKLRVNIPAEHSPSPPPSPSVATPSNPFSPSASPIITHSRPSLTPLKSSIGLPASPSTPYSILRRDSTSKPPASAQSACFDALPSPSTSFSQAEPSPVASIRSIPVLDPALPLLRDVKKLFKRCAKLGELEWIRRGTWILDTRSSAPAKTTSLANVKVEFVAPVSEAEWQGEEAGRWKWAPGAVERVGQAWVGEVAESLAKEREELGGQQDVHHRESSGSVGRGGAKRRPSMNAVNGTATTTTPKVESGGRKASGRNRRSETKSGRSSSQTTPPKDTSPSPQESTPSLASAESGSPTDTTPVEASPPATGGQTSRRRTASANEGSDKRRGGQGARQRSASGTAPGERAHHARTSRGGAHRAHEGESKDPRRHYTTIGRGAS